MADISIEVLTWTAAAPEAVPIRTSVFVREQSVPQEMELDEWDERCDHAVARAADGRAVGTGRLLPDGHIGRMAVLPEARGKGVGSAILAALIERARARGLTRALLHAQTHAIPFYSRHGFSVCSERFLDAGIPHVTMARELH